ncbi:MAG: sensor histidine kinase [Ardenticatenaceae bacterium]|nr:sensor histidine kinase [Ardenticatenaceae bacterium]MCB8948520.1 sensor histidine kinase [Ardenticatenaceae bacterium]
MHIMTRETAVSTQTPSFSHRLKAWLAELRDVKWAWVVFPGIAVAFINVIIIGTIISLYASFLSVEFQSPEATAEAVGQGATLIGTYASPVVQFLATIWVAYLVCKRQGTAVTWYGLLIGIVSGTAAALQVALFAGVPLHFFFDLTLLTFFPAPMFAGWIGARRSQKVLAVQQRVYLASQAIAHAPTPQAIVNAIGEHLATANVHQIGLWEILLQGAGGRPTAVSLLAAWTAKQDDTWQPGLQLTADTTGSLDRLAPDKSLQIKAMELPAAEKQSWETLGARSALLIPLVTPTGSWVGLLTVTSPASGGLSRSSEQDFVTIAAQVALVLDNLRLVAQAKETAVLRERQRLAREIHDTLAQGFTSIVMHLEAAEQALPTDQATTERHLDQARTTARDSLAQARRVVDDLRPELLESTPFDQAINRVVEQWAAHSGVTAEFRVTGEIQPLHPQVEVTLLRSSQEALANIRKHAQANTACVTLSYLGDTVILDVEDDGVGLAQQKTAPDGLTSGGFGLVAMQERVTQLGGELFVESEPGEGTTLSISLPIVSEVSS